MSLYSVRKILIQVEEVRYDGGPLPQNPNCAAPLLQSSAIPTRENTWPTLLR